MDDQPSRLTSALADRYRLGRPLGEGGMATVYLAHDLKHNRQVAIKVLKPELAAVVGAERFLAEIETTANLQHPHILPLFDSGEADGFLFYVMPYVEGETLWDRIDREHQLPVDEALGIAVAFSPDGMTIVFNQRGNLVTRPVRGGAATTLVSTEFVLAGDYSDADDWDLHPDGDRFVMLRFVGNGRDEGGEGGIERSDTSS
jgi:hypothetical protein